jgi:hypothetical protein
MVRKLADKKWMDRVPDSAMAFLNGMSILLVGVILYYFGGPPTRDQFLVVKALAIAAGIAAVNYFIFTFKGRYKNIVEYYESKYVSRPPWFAYFIIPICYILLMYAFSLVHNLYSDYYRINGLK